MTAPAMGRFVCSSTTLPHRARRRCVAKNGKNERSMLGNPFGRAVAVSNPVTAALAVAATAATAPSGRSAADNGGNDP